MKGFESFRRMLPTSLVALPVLVLALVAVPSRAGATTVGPAVSAAASYAQAHGVRAGVVVLDRSTGHWYEAGSYNSYFGSASVMKLFVADKLLATGQMTGWKATAAYKMITQSDDASLEKLLPYVGGTSVINWVEARYHINIGYPSSKSWCWGNTHIIPSGLARFYYYMERDVQVRGWLVNAMHHFTSYGSDGTNQRFGIPSATSGAGIKQGWGHCSADSGGTVVHSTGLVNSDRFIVVILTESTRGYFNSNAFNSWEAGVVTTMARMILPGGKITL